MDTAPTSLAEGDVRSQARRGLAVFFAILVPLTAIFQAIITTGNTLWVFALMWSVAAASVVARLVLREGFADVSFRFGGRRTWKYIALAPTIPIVIGLIAYGIAWATGYPRRSGKPAATAEATGVKIAAPHAATTLPPSSTWKLGASAAATLVIANSSRAPPKRRLLSKPLAAETSRGEPIAKVTAKTLTRSPALATEMERSSAMSGSTPVTTKVPVPTAKEPTDRTRIRRTIAGLRSPACPLL